MRHLLILQLLFAVIICNIQGYVIHLNKLPNTPAVFQLRRQAVHASSSPLVDSTETTTQLNSNSSSSSSSGPQFSKTLVFLSRAVSIGLITGLSIVVFKQSISFVGMLLFEDLADLLPKPAFYWPLAIYPILGSLAVAAVTYAQGSGIRNGIDSIASAVDSEEIESQFLPLDQLARTVGAIFTLGSGCSLGPEGPSVEIGATVSSLIVSMGDKQRRREEQQEITPFDKLLAFFSSNPCTPLERRQLFLAGTAAAVSGGFNAPIAGVFFALECGNRYLSKNNVPIIIAVPIIEDDQDGVPRADIAAIVLAASLADIVVGLGLKHTESFTLQGNYYAMLSPLFELPLYIGLGLLSGFISVLFTLLRGFYSDLFDIKAWGSHFPLASIPPHFKPIIGGVVCGAIAVFYPQTLFAGYTTLDQILSGQITLPLPLLLQLLFIKLQLTSFSLATGLIGGVFAPALFFGATAGAAYQNTIHFILMALHDSFDTSLPSELVTWSNSFFSLASAPAYATVGAAATLGALFRAPLTSSMLMFELTQNHDIVLPVLAATGVGGLFAEIISHPRKQW